MSVTLHIGVGKTGTTSLQHFFKAFCPQLESQGFYTLKTGAVQGESIAHHDLATAFGFAHIKPVETMTVKEKVAAELNTVKDKKVLISSENFHSRVDAEKLSNLADCLSTHEVKIVMYMRRQDQWIDSAFRQFVQVGNQRSIEAIAEHIISTKAVDYSWQIEQWGEVFGFENIIPRVYEKSQMEGDTITDFSSVVGLKLDEEMATTRFEANPSLSPIEAEMCRLINVISKQKADSREKLLELLQSDSSIEHDQYHFMGKEQRTKILDLFAEGNAAVADRYFPKNNSVLFNAESDVRDYRKIVNFH